jgi:HSP20 family protein
MRAYNTMSTSAVNERPAVPRVDLLETPEHFVVLMDLPGVPKEGLNISVLDDVLTVKGTPERSDAQEKRLLYGEVEHGTFQRDFRLAMDVVDIDNVTAHLENGVLSMTLPKQENKRLRRIPVRRIERA